MAIQNFSAFSTSPQAQRAKLEYHFLLSRDLGFLTSEKYELLHHAVEEVKKMLASLARKVNEERLAS